MTSRNNPFDALEQMFDRMGRQFQTAARSWDAGEAFDLALPGQSMAVDIVEEDDAYRVEVTVPGFSRDEVDVRLADEQLTIEAEHEAETEDESEHYLRRERQHRTLRRSIRLPADVVPDDVHATMSDGILTITVPKRDPGEEGSHVDIEVE